MAGLQFQDIVTSQQGQSREQLAQTAQAATIPAPITIAPGQASGGVNLNLPKPANDIALANATAAGGAQTSKTLQDYIDQLTTPNTALDTQNTALMDRLSALYGQDTGKATATADAETAAGLPDMNKQLKDILGQINIKNAEYDKLNTDLQGQPIPLAFITGQQLQTKRAQAADIGVLSARALATQGNITAAHDAIDRAINLRYQGIEEEITAKEKQLQLIQPQLNQQQQKIAQAQSLMLADQKQQIADEKDKAAANIKLALSSGVTTRFANKNGEFFDTNSGVAYSNPADFFKAAGVSSFEEAYAKKLVTDINASTSIDLKQYPASYQEYLLAKQDGYKGSYNDYQTMDANRKAVRSTTNNITYNQAQDQANQTDRSQTQANLSSVAGRDGYVNTADWKRAYNEWVGAGHPAKDFIDNFSGFINPKSIDPYFGAK